jgi:pseudouridine-5'-phosphate glycosidase
MSVAEWLTVAPEVASALAAGHGVVALESSLIAQGLPTPENLETALAAERAVRDAGAVPATTAIVDGQALVGIDRATIERLAEAGAAAKAASRDIGPLLAAGRLASTTVSATVRLASAAGISVAATGGIGGVHRGASASFDISSDIDELATTPVAVVCSGVKSILDLPATFELLETRRVPVIGYATGELPAFYAASGGLPLSHRVDDPAGAAAIIAAHCGIPGSGGLVFVQPPPSDVALDGQEVEAWISAALRDAVAVGVRGAAVTPHVLAHIARASGGRALRANVALIVNNAATAGRIAVALVSHRS